MKNDRQKKIIELVENRCIETQEQLLDQLRQCGFHSTQATVSRECVTNIDYAQNIIVIKTMPGLGAAAGANIDSLKMPNMVGSLSGDDTTLVIMRDKESAAEFCRELHRMLE